MCDATLSLTIQGHRPWTLEKPPATRASLPNMPPGTENTGLTSGNAFRRSSTDFGSATATGSERPQTVDRSCQVTPGQVKSTPAGSGKVGMLRSG